MISYAIHGGFRTRDGTTDADAVFALADDEYRLEGRSLSGWAIDVGAHIGTISITLARLNPNLRVVSVEAVPDNANLLEQNVAAAGLSGQISVERAFAGGPGQVHGTCHYGYRHHDLVSDGFISAHRFVGGTWGSQGDPEFSAELPAVSLDTLIERYLMGEVSLLKIDCEGCEWRFLDNPAVSKVRTIVGEYHGGLSGVKTPQAKIVELLGPTHDVELWMPDEPVVGLFEAVRR